MMTPEEFQAWLEEAGVEVRGGALGSVRLKDVVVALIVKVIALEARMTDLD